jgi:hypothetical protein
MGATYRVSLGSGILFTALRTTVTARLRGRSRVRGQSRGLPGLLGGFGDHRTDQHDERRACGEPVDAAAHLVTGELLQLVARGRRRDADHRDGGPPRHDALRGAPRGPHVGRRADGLRQVRHEDREHQRRTHGAATGDADAQHGVLRNAVEKGACAETEHPADQSSVPVPRDTCE